MKQTWINSGSTYTQVDAEALVKDLPVGVYTIEMSIQGPYLKKVFDKFVMPDKIYGGDNSFIDKVVKSWGKTNKNLGVLLNGVRGSGKTVTAKRISNQVDLPVILVERTFDGGIRKILADFDFNAVILIDEYEKLFDDSPELLSVIDGTHNNNSKHLYLLTSNKNRVNENMINRPSRLRYIREYSDLTKGVIEEILNDILVDKSKVEDAVNLVKRFEIITVDLVKEFANEMNNLEVTAEQAFVDFNISLKSDACYVQGLDDDNNPIILGKLLGVDLEELEKTEEGESTYIGDRNMYLGEFVKYEKGVLTTTGYNMDKRRSEKGFNRFEHIYTWEFDKVQTYHSAYAF